MEVSTGPVSRIVEAARAPISRIVGFGHA